MAERLGELTSRERKVVGRASGKMEHGGKGEAMGGGVGWNRGWRWRCVGVEWRDGFSRVRNLAKEGPGRVSSYMG